MAHEISVNQDGKAEAMYAYTPAWNGLGVVVEGDVGPMDALKLAGLHWSVRKETLYRTNFDEIPDRVAICRSDDGRYLGTVGQGFHPIQNVEQAAFVEEICGVGNAVVDSCGALRGGRRTFWTIKLPNALTISEQDTVQRYLIVANAHDGTLSFRAFWSPIRVVCTNTLNAALRRSQSGVSLRHTASILSRVSEAKKVLGLANEYYGELSETFTALSRVSLDDKGFSTYLNEVLPVPPDANDDSAVHEARRIVSLNWQQGRGVEFTSKSMWRAYNSVTEFTSHQRQLRGKLASVKAENRFNTVMLGASKMLQQIAFDTALQIAGLN